MSALRWNPPGQPVVLIDLGPARGRATNGNGSLGGPIEPAKAMLPSRAPLTRGQRKPIEVARCGIATRYTGEPCARRLGHRDNHRTAFGVERDNARRRTTNYAR